MNNIFLLIDNETRTTLSEFIEANKSDGFDGIDAEDIATIENLKAGESHYIACHAAFCHVKRLPSLDNLSPYERFQLEKYGNILGKNISEIDEVADNDKMSMAEEAYIYSLENPNV